MEDMQKAIQENLDEIEKQKGVRILYAIESGSRAWGFSSPDSDYDVRFIYVRPLEDYLLVNPVRDTIEWMDDGILDINGWDLRKALSAFGRPNPTLFEWALSPIVYRQAPEWERIKEVGLSYFSEKETIDHYLGIAQNTYSRYLTGELISYKKYFYCLRPLLCCRWVEERHSVPPMAFGELKILLQSRDYPEGLIEEVEELLTRKAVTGEKEGKPQMPLIQAFLQSELTRQKEIRSSYPSQGPRDYGPLNEVFRNILKES